MRHRELPTDWKSLLQDCNFELARAEIASFFEIADREAAARGGTVVYRTEFVRGWQRFAENPNFETAVGFIEGAPEDAATIAFPYFIECCPGGRFMLYQSLLEPREDK